MRASSVLPRKVCGSARMIALLRRRNPARRGACGSDLPQVKDRLVAVAVAVQLRGARAEGGNLFRREEGFEGLNKKEPPEANGMSRAYCSLPQNWKAVESWATSSTANPAS